MTRGTGAGASVKVWRWIATLIAAVAAAGCLWLAPGCMAASADGVGSPPLTPPSQGGEREWASQGGEKETPLQHGEADGVGSPPLAPPSQGGERERASQGGERESQGGEANGVDPAVAAREVLGGEDFWWKHIEQKTVQLTGPLAFLQRALEWIGWVLKPVWDFIVEVLRRVVRFFRSLYAVLRGDWSEGMNLIWLVAMVVLGWAMWKLYPLLKYLPVIARWLAGGGAPGAKNATTVSWETLPESSDLFMRASDAFAAREFADAIRLALLALIARLEKQGLLRYDNTRTNREYQRELRPHKDLAATFAHLARIYERVWYGREKAGPAEAQEAIGLCKLLINREELVAE